MSEIRHKVMGKIKQVVGRVTGNERMQSEGESELLRGKVEGVVADTKEVAEASKDKLAHAAKSHRK